MEFATDCLVVVVDISENHNHLVKLGAALNSNLFRYMHRWSLEVEELLCHSKVACIHLGAIQDGDSFQGDILGIALSLEDLEDQVVGKGDMELLEEVEGRPH